MILKRYRGQTAAIVVLLHFSAVGCSATSSKFGRPQQSAEALAGVKSIALVYPNVRIVRQGVARGPTPYEQEVSEWTAGARQNIVQAIFTHFGKHFSIKEFKTTHSADATLVVTASDVIKSYDRRFMDTLGLAYGAFLMPVLYVTAVPLALILNPQPGNLKNFNREMLKAMWPAGLTTVKLELADTRSGELIWAFSRESRSGYDLRDATSVEVLIGEAIEDLLKIMSVERRECILFECRSPK